MMSEYSEQQRICQLRLRQVFSFLKELNDHRNPAVRQIKEQPWMMWLDDLPDHPTIRLPTCTIQTNDQAKTTELQEEECRFQVRRPQLTPPPAPPEILHGWLLDGWENPERDLKWATSRNELENGETVTITFDKDPHRVEALNRWQIKHDAWRQAELPARRAMAIFEKLYELHGKLKRESERFDLVVGDGLLSWEQSDGNIHHPLLIQRVSLQFDPQIPEFKIIDAESKSELNTSLFQTISDIDPKLLAARREELEVGGYHPFSVEADAFLKGLVNQLSAQGTFAGRCRPEAGSRYPAIGRVPTLFLRSRTKGYGTAITKALESVQTRDDFCQALQNIVGIDTYSKEITVTSDPVGYRELPQKDILFGKEANQEQFRIARQLDRHGSVLVQGPPGTGKSHTIANLIGHLLAHNQSVLVTSHSTKALQVLRGLVVEELRPLCVSVLDNDPASRSELKAAVMAISSKLSESGSDQPDQLDREADSLERERNQLLAELHEYQSQLCQARADEYREIVYGGKGIRPSDAARLVAAGRDRHDWIPSPVALGEPLPLTFQEVRELYQTNSVALSKDDELTDRPFPKGASLPTPDQFQQAIESLSRLELKITFDRSYWPKVAFTEQHISTIRRLLTFPV